MMPLCPVDSDGLTLLQITLYKSCTGNTRMTGLITLPSLPSLLSHTQGLNRITPSLPSLPTFPTLGTTIEIPPALLQGITTRTRVKSQTALLQILDD